ncbi:MAG: hypothetical protein JKY51_00365 [Opitutaceae bacterium]|nr:hypothetical protein [Opitutaceae bacterium]
MLSSSIKEIARYKSKIASLEKKIEAEQKKLISLHTKLGYSSRAGLIKALMDLGPSGKASPKAAKKSGKKISKSTSSSGRKKRTTITPALRASIVKALKSGEKGLKVAKDFAVSIPTIQNIKIAAGLIKKRKK